MLSNVPKPRCNSLPFSTSHLMISVYCTLQAVDVIGKAGTPKTIAGVHTHTTPVLLAVGERAELATDDFNPLTPVMEGFVILRKKPVTDN